MTMDDFLNSQRFKQAIFDVHDQECERFAATMEPVTFSLKFERKMDRLLRAQRSSFYPLVNTNFKKAVLAMAVVLILIITTVFSVSALREPVIRFFVEVYEKFSTVFFHSGEVEQTPPITLEVFYEPAWLPDGYASKEEMTALSDTVCIRFYFSENDMITLQQHTVFSRINLDTEGAEIQSTLVRGQDALLYHNKGVWTLVWNDHQYGFSLSGPEADLLRIAESIRVVEK